MLPETNQALQHLPTGPVGVGEDHTNPKGRQVVLELLQLKPKPVENLFVEVREWGNNLITEAVKSLGRGGNVESQMVNNIPEQYGNPVFLGSVIASAIRSGVWVYCVDGGSRVMTARNRFIWDQFRIKTTKYGRTARSLLLIGGDHFDGEEPTLRTMIQGLLYLKCG